VSEVITKLDGRLRRARSLIATWEADRLLVVNYLSGKRSTVSVPVVQVLCALDEYAALPEIEAELGLPQIEGLLSKLRNEDLIVEEGSGQAIKDELVDESWPWTHEAGFFHFATNDLDFVTDPSEQREYLLRRAAQVPPPSPYKEYDRAGTALPRRRDGRNDDLWAVLRARRTCREFSGGSIGREDLAEILLWTWGSSRHLSFPRTGDLVGKTSPSGGARHPIEVYPVILAVDGIDPGIYHYSVRDHSITSLRSGRLAELAVELCSGQESIRRAAAVFFMTAVVERSSWKYPSSHAYRVIQLDAGHLGQTFHLVCTALALGPLTFAATRNRAVEEALGIDGVKEIVVYTAAVGVPVPQAYPEVR
jgi:SagB-type dehydrogenase family enzyme